MSLKVVCQCSNLVRSETRRPCCSGRLVPASHAAASTASAASGTCPSAVATVRTARRTGPYLRPSAVALAAFFAPIPHPVSVTRDCQLTFIFCSRFLMAAAAFLCFSALIGSGCMSIDSNTKLRPFASRLLTDGDDEGSESVTTHDTSIVHYVLGSHLPKSHKNDGVRICFPFQKHPSFETSLEINMAPQRIKSPAIFRPEVRFLGCLADN